MPLATFNQSLPTTVSAFDNIQLILTLAVFVVMVTLVSLCTCCGNAKQARKEESDDCDYGVVTVAAVSDTINKQQQQQQQSSVHTINFREHSSKKAQERHSQPVTKMSHVSFNRQSAPGRALPKLPADLYTAIDKKPKTDDIRFADEAINPMYECIDAETDSFVDPLYSKVGAPGTSTAKDIKYDYPIFPGRQKEDMVYQSASQVYAAGSEDPYSSITSERGRNNNFVDKDGDNSSTYDPGYAKVNLSNKPKTVGQERIERSERELDLLYSKIRRNAPTYDDQPGPSRVEPVLPEIPVQQGPVFEQLDEQRSAVSSREPSYRYITMRENADVLRERLRQQGQLDRPIREHYYSTIGNEYETIANRSEPLIVTTAAVITEMDIPPPPTSPIPERSRPVSFIEANVPSPPDLRCSPVPPKPAEQTFSIKNKVEEPVTFRSLETLIGRRTMEEKETIIEQRSTVAVGISIPSTSTTNNNSIMSRSVDNSWNPPVHEVTIRRLDKPYEGPSVDSIISGRRYRSGQGLSEEKPATSIPKDTAVEPASSALDSSQEPAKPKRKISHQESEDDKIRRLGTIYTANDYISSVDMTGEKPWPMNNQ